MHILEDEMRQVLVIGQIFDASSHDFIVFYVYCEGKEVVVIAHLELVYGGRSQALVRNERYLGDVQDDL